MPDFKHHFHFLVSERSRTGPRLTPPPTLEHSSSRTRDSALFAVLTRPREPPLGRALPAHLASQGAAYGPGARSDLAAVGSLHGFTVRIR
eukprot:4924795-Prymnesium_polylepis.1